jgi:molybdopterin-guanine dinucleotide biosynthesis protein A
VTFDALILAGGHSTRLGGADKALVVVGGKTLLERAVDAVASARQTIVAGPVRKLTAAVTWVQEEPPGAGPGAALVAGSRLIRAELVVVLAVDHPLVTRVDIGSLLEGVRGDGAIAVDPDGREQPLVAAYRREALTAALDRSRRTIGGRIGDLIGNLELGRVELGEAAADCDTWEAIEAVRRRARMRG